MGIVHSALGHTEFPLSTITIVAALTTIATFDVKHLSKLYVQVSAATNPFTAFQINMRPHQSASYQTRYSLAADFTNPPSGGRLLACSADLTILSAATAYFELDVEGIESVQLKATGGAGGTLVNVYAGGN